MKTMLRTMKSRLGRRLLWFGVMMGWRIAKSPEGRKALGWVFAQVLRRRKKPGRQTGVVTRARRVGERVRA